METEAASELVLKAPRTRKPKTPTVKRPRKPAKDMIVANTDALVPERAPGKVYGWPIADGFARIMIFSGPNDGNKVTFVECSLGDHPKVYLAKNKMHVLPMGLVNNIIDTTQVFPVDDLSDEMKPKRYFEARPRFPHSEPIPATAEEYIKYRQEQERLPHPNTKAKT